MGIRVSVVRRGGLAGIALRGEADTAELPRDAASAAQAFLQARPIDQAPAEPRHPDGFRYEITFTAAAGVTRSVSLDESEVPDQLRPLIQLAMQRGTLG